MATIVPSWTTIKTMARNLGVTFEQSNTQVSMECAALDAFGDFYPEGHDEEARQQAYEWLIKTQATLDARAEAALQARVSSHSRRGSTKGTKTR
jgi:hypothetical protein